MRSDPQSEILVYLLRTNAAKARTVKMIAKAIGRSESTVRNNIAVMSGDYAHPGDPWIEAGFSRSAGKATVYTLTDKGREVARYRSRRG